MNAMYRVALRFLLERFCASRADFGFGAPNKPIYLPTAVELVSSLFVPPFDSPFPNHVWPVQEVWQSPGPVCQNLDNRPGIDNYWSNLGAKSKVARRLEVEDRIFGVICVDDTDEVRTWYSLRKSAF